MANSLFEDREQTIFYQKYRHVPPQSIYDRIFKFLGEKLSSPYKIAVDAGCGSGQSTKPLAGYFELVYGCDISKEQINQAIINNKHSNIIYKQTPSEKLDLADNSVQLITVCAALHWFDIKEFFKEVDRILVPNGVLAVSSYKFIGDYHTVYPEVNELYRKFFEEVLIPNFASNVQINDCEYRNVSFPYDEQNFFRNDPELDVTFSISLDDMVGYLRSWSAYQTFISKNPTQKDKVLELKNSIMEVFNKNNATDMNIQSPRHHFLIMCRKPSS